MCKYFTFKGKNIIKIYYNRNVDSQVVTSAKATERNDMYAVIDTCPLCYKTIVRIILALSKHTTHVYIGL